MQIAHIVAERGTCDRKQVGAVIAREGRIITVGYNGAPPGLPHCDENYHGWGPWVEEKYRQQGRRTWRLNELRADVDYQLQSGCRNATHAEANALAFAAKYGVSTEGAELYVTVSPCENCARLLIAAGIKAVYYSERYRMGEGTALLLRANLKVEQLES